MSALKSTSCCGVYELHDLSGHPTDLSVLVGGKAYPHFLLTDTKGRKNGEKLVKIIEDNKLGAIVYTKYKNNPNSNNSVRAWLFTPNWTRLKKFCKVNSTFKVIGKPGDVEVGDLVTAVKDAPYTITVYGYIGKVTDKDGGMIRMGGYDVSAKHFTKIKLTKDE